MSAQSVPKRPAVPSGAVRDAAKDARLPGRPVFDWSGLLVRLENDGQLAAEVIAMFLQEHTRLLEDVREAVKKGNALLLEKSAHAMKGSAGDITAAEVFNVACRLEVMGREGKLDGAGEVLKNLEVALDRLVAELRNTQKGA